MTNLPDNMLQTVPITTIKLIDSSSSPVDTENDHFGTSRDFKRMCPVLDVVINDKSYRALVDTGCSVTAINEDVYRKIVQSGMQIPALPVNRTVVIGANRLRSEPVRKQVFIPFRICSGDYEVVMIVIRNLLYPIILGMNFLNKYKAVIDLDCKQMYLAKNVKNTDSNNMGSKLLCSNVMDVVVDEVSSGVLSRVYAKNAAPEIMGLSRVRAKDANPEIPASKISKVSASNAAPEELSNVIYDKVNECHDLNDEQKEALKTLLLNNYKVFTKSKEPIVNYQFRIELNDYQPFKQKVYPIPLKFKPETDKLISEMLADGIIKRETTAYINPLVIVKKKTGDLRICLDARKLNMRTIPFSDRPPQIDEILLRFGGQQYYTSTDFISAYYQVEIRKRDQIYTGFLYNGITYVFQRMPFGLKNSGSALIQCLDAIIQRYMGENAIVYVDDVVIVSKSFKDHLFYLNKFFQLLLANNMRLNLNKSEFCKTEIKFLGHHITRNGIKMDPEKVAIIDKIQPPRNRKQLKGFIGTCQYYARFCKNFSLVLSPLYALLKKGVKFCWTVECQRTFEEVKAMFYRTSVISYPDYEHSMYLQTDSSEHGMGAILFQVIDGREKIIQLVSGTYKGPEIRYSTTEKEAYAIIFAIKKLKFYLVGRHFVILTDHKALTFLLQCLLSNDRLTRWIVWLQQFSFEIRHIPGQQNHLPDLLSRQTPERNRIQGNTSEQIIAAIDLLVETMPELNWREVSAMQDDDETIRKIKLMLSGEMREDHEDFRYFHDLKDRWKLVDGVILYKTCNEPALYRILWPKVWVVRLVQYVHSSYAHYGADKIFLLIKDLIYWKNMFRDIRKILAKCDVCLRTKFPNRYYQGAMQNIIPKGKNDLVAIDLYGPLPKTAYGNRFVMVIVNVFTKFTQVYAVNKPNARNCLKHLRKYLELIGNCQRVLTDHGTQFTSSVWRDTLRDLGIQSIHSTIRHPQSNPSERIMRELSRLFRVYCRNNHRSWIEVLPYINEWLNSVPHDSIRITPYEAQFGEKPTGILSGLERPEIARGYRTNLTVILDELIKKGRSRITKAKKKGHLFKANQKVLLRVPRVSHPNLGQFH